MGDMVIAVYRPKDGREEELLQLVKEHVPILRRLGLATDRPALAMRARNGEIVEAFEWKTGAIAKAHEHPEVQELWSHYERVCDYVPLQALAEAGAPFAQFDPLDVD